MNELEAHLDRGWELVSRHDLAAAEKSARRALAIDRDAPEAWVLLGAIENARGDAEAALEHFEKALDLAPDDPDALLSAAETCLCALDDPERAIELCNSALDSAQGEDQFVDAILLKADAELTSGDDQAAKKTLSELPDADFEDPGMHLHAGRLWLDLGDLGRAEAQLKKVLAGDPDDADAWHTLGCVAEAREDRDRMIECWRKVRELDLAAPRMPWRLLEKEFEKVAEDALGELPERARSLLANVPILISEYPPAEVIEEGYDPRMLGFFSGVPYPERSNVGGAPHLDCIQLYQRNIERQSPTRDVMVEETRITLIHETGHFFGLDDDELEDIGLG